MISIVCDICRKPCDNLKFNLPMNNVYLAQRCGETVMSFSCLENVDVNLCRDCQERIAGVVDIMKGEAEDDKRI